MSSTHTHTPHIPTLSFATVNQPAKNGRKSPPSARHSRDTSPLVSPRTLLSTELTSAELLEGGGHSSHSSHSGQPRKSPRGGLTPRFFRRLYGRHRIDSSNSSSVASSPRDNGSDTRARNGSVLAATAMPDLTSLLSRDYSLARKIEIVCKGEFGTDANVRTLVGVRRITYADYTAAARPLVFIEDILRDHVLPMFANTHTEVSTTGLQTTYFREEARAIIKECINAGPNDHLIFTGTGSTAAMAKLRDVVGLQVPHWIRKLTNLDQLIPPEKLPVIFVGPMEHHSNEIMWRETIAKVVAIPPGPDGRADQTVLEKELLAHQHHRLLIGSFCAGSNVTGIIEHVDELAKLLHKHEAFACFDFAGVGPYVDIDINKPYGAHMDAIYLSVHKFPGGAGTPGILVAKSALLKGSPRLCPTIPGGGTVALTSPTNQVYVSDPEVYEEAGTPGIVQSIRAGLVFRLKKEIGATNISEIESRFAHRAIEFWQKNPNILLMGAKYTGFFDKHRTSILSFVIKRPEKNENGHFLLHHHFVCALLSDLFGIQSRSGCSCTGPLGFRLFDFDQKIEDYMTENYRETGRLGMKPGWTRVNFNYFISEAQFLYIVKAVDLIAREGWKLLPLYRMNLATGQFINIYFDNTAFVKNLSNINIFDYAEGIPPKGKEFERIETSASTSVCYEAYLRDAEALFKDAPNIIRRVCLSNMNTIDNVEMSALEKDECMDFYVTPMEAMKALGLPLPPVLPSRTSFFSLVSVIMVVQRLLRTHYAKKHTATRKKKNRVFWLSAHLGQKHGVSM